MDHDFVWDEAHSMDPLPGKLPDNWLSPVDYLNGELQFRLQVTEKADDTPVWLEICMWQEKLGGPHTCLNCLQPPFRSPGEYTCRMPMRRKKELDFTRPFVATQIRIKDGSQGRGLDLVRVGKGLPIKAHYQVVLVPAGQRFSGWR